MAEESTVSTENALASTIDEFNLIGNKSGEKVSILDGIVSMSYYESIQQNSVVVSVTYADSGTVTDGTDKKSVLEGLPLVGSEKSMIKFTDNNKVSVELGDTKNNYLFVNKVTPISDQTTKGMVSLNLVSKEFIMNEKGGTRVVKRMDGKISDSVNSIFKNNLKTEKKLDVEETENNFNFIPNNKKPMYTLDWISKKSVPKGKKGKSAGFFFWETSEGFHFKSIDMLMDEKKNKPKKSIIYNETTDKRSEDIPAGYQVKAVEFSKDNKIHVQDKFKMGFQSTRIITFNPFDGYYEVKNSEAKTDDLDTAGKELPTMCKELKSEGEGKDYTRTTYYIKDTGTLNSGNTTDEQVGKSKEENFEISEIENQAIQRYNQLYSSQTSITIAGDFSLHAGDTLFVDGPSLQVDTKNDEIDKEHGGMYLISDLVHFLNDKGTWTKMNLVRDSFGRKGKASDTEATGRGGPTTETTKSDGATPAKVQRPVTGENRAGGGQMSAGGTPGFDERTGRYSDASLPVQDTGLTEKQMRERTAARENLPENQVGAKATGDDLEEIQKELNMKGTRENPLW